MKPFTPNEVAVLQAAADIIHNADPAFIEYLQDDLLPKTAAEEIGAIILWLEDEEGVVAQPQPDYIEIIRGILEDDPQAVQDGIRLLNIETSNG